MVQSNVEIQGVNRTVQSSTVDDQPAVAVAMVQLSTDVHDLWSAVTKIERIPRWFAPITGNLDLNGRFQIEGNAAGTITRCEAPHAYDTTWEYGDGISWLKVRTARVRSGKAQLTISHIAHPDEHWEQFGPAAVGIGWDPSLLGLHEYLINNTSIPTERTVWGTSPEAAEFMAGSGEAWIAADIARGENPDDATRRGKSTIGFYTGTSETK